MKGSHKYFTLWSYGLARKRIHIELSLIHQGHISSLRAFLPYPLLSFCLFFLSSFISRYLHVGHRTAAPELVSFGGVVSRPLFGLLY
jgi:hypothetical protein